MSYAELIHEYLDLGLDEARQEALFSEIARNPEVRSEFNSQMRIHNIAKTDLNSISPPSEVTTSIFNKLSFASPVASKSGFWTALSLPFLAGIGGLIAGGLIFLSVFNDDIFGDNNNLISENPTNNTNLINFNNNPLNNGELSEKLTTSVSNSKLEKAGLPVSTNNRSLIKDNNNILNNTSLTISNKENSKSLLYNQDKDTNTNSEIRKETFELQDYLNSKTYRPIFVTSNSNSNYFSNLLLKKLGNEGLISKSNIIYSNRISTISNSQNFVTFISSESELFSEESYSSTSIFDIASDNTKWSLGLRQLNNIGSVSNLNNESGFLLNRAITLQYKYSSNWVFFAEVGSEKFLQQFNRRVAGTDVITTQNPLLTWFGLGAKYRVVNLWEQNFFVPYLQSMLAANQVGPILRPQVGFEMRPSKFFTLNVAYENAIMFYSVHNQNLSASNQGISVGFNFNF